MRHNDAAAVQVDPLMLRQAAQAVFDTETVRQLDNIATASGRLCNDFAAAESNYRAADAASHTAVATVDDRYLRGR